MKKVVDYITSTRAKGQLPFLLVFATLAIAVLCVAYNNPSLVAFLLLLISVLSQVTKITESPAPEVIANMAGVFLENSCTALKNQLSVFRALYYDLVPIEESEDTKAVPRWEWCTIMRNGVKVVCVSLLRVNATSLSRESLQQERRVLQSILCDDMRRGYIPEVMCPTFLDGTPTLYILDIYEYGAYINFEFVWVDTPRVSEFVHRYELPPNGDNSDDEDF